MSGALAFHQLRQEGADNEQEGDPAQQEADPRRDGLAEQHAATPFTVYTISGTDTDSLQRPEQGPIIKHAPWCDVAVTCLAGSHCRDDSRYRSAPALDPATTVHIRLL